ncbi:MAG: cytochrome c biogenesis protein ResB [Bdellovibrionaceae bacterium]|nr:cytochrome c biogenesis protein ResB [Bdellovibrionales bacterium]MCB9082916.1 cytochrome c biogenesis protein ResB [Pseudobdellovibrionaceae bacterium]
MKFLERLFKTLISVKLAVVVILMLGILSAVGTIYESKYDAEYAQKLVYHSPLMYFFMGLMCVQLICVMIDRWPWKMRHAPFLLAHVGIIITLAGSLVTRYVGLDGSMTFNIGQTTRHVTVSGRELLVYASFDGQKFTPVGSRSVDFLLEPPDKHPVAIQLGTDKIEVLDYYHYAYRKQEIVPSESEFDGPAIRFQLQNDRVNVSRWLFLGRGQGKDIADLGPAKVVLTDSPYKNMGLNAIVFNFDPNKKQIKYEIRSKERGVSKKGDLEEGLSVETGWMGLQLRILRYIPTAKRETTYEHRQYPTPQTVSALKVKFNDEEHWMGANTVLRLFTETNVYVLSYGNKRVELPFDLTLSDFRVGRYQGTMQAMSYESDVLVKGLGKTTISMNNPLKHQGFTFYQASFQEDESGKPVMSILSVNQDPGRFWKYLGSLMVTLGAILLFWEKSLKKWIKEGEQGDRA